MRILLVEDEAPLRETLAARLKREGFAVDAAGDGEEGLYNGREVPFDMAIIDLGLPKMSGMDLVRALRSEGKKFPILILTARSSWQDKVEGLKSGADDYLVKPFAIQELEARLRALIRRDRRQVSAEVLKVADLILDTASLRVTRGGKEIQLSPIGLRLLTILMRESPRVVTRRDIEREIWGDGLPDSDTLRSHLYNLRKAIDRPFDKQLLHTVQTAGYRIADLDTAPAA